MAFQFDAAAALARARAAADTSPAVPTVPTALRPGAETVGTLGTVGRGGTPDPANVDAFKEGETLSKHDDGASFGHAKRAAANKPGLLSRVPDAQPRAGGVADPEVLLDYLCEHGSATQGVAATALIWGASRAWRAEAALRIEVAYDRLGRAVLTKQG